MWACYSCPVADGRCSYPGAVLLVLRSAPLEDLQLNNVEGQQAQGEAAHAAYARVVTGTFNIYRVSAHATRVHGHGITTQQEANPTRGTG